jgi:tetratricopeptide (TPR) repeat protein
LLTAVLACTTATGLLAQGPALAPRALLEQGNAALQSGETDKALSILTPMLNPAHPSGEAREQAKAHNLACRIFYILERWDRAAGECETAVRLDGVNSDYHLWLGRALGERASRASFLSAYSLGKRVRGEFEEAVRLDPRNLEALADLGDFYYQAPGIVGGGQDKAENIARQMEPLDAARAMELRAKIAEDHKDLGTAERLLKQAVSVGIHPAFQWMGLAGFYRRHQRWNEMEAAVESGFHAAERDHKANVANFHGANILISSGRNPQLATKLLENYLGGAVKTEEAPAFIAHLKLAQLKEQAGDTAFAQRERAAALALAHDYHPAQAPRH